MTQTCPRNYLKSRMLSTLRLPSKSIITQNDSQHDEKTSILQEPSTDWVGLTGRVNINRVPGTSTPVQVSTGSRAH